MLSSLAFQISGFFLVIRFEITRKNAQLIIRCFTKVNYYVHSTHNSFRVRIEIKVWRSENSACIKYF